MSQTTFFKKTLPATRHAWVTAIGAAIALGLLLMPPEQITAKQESAASSPAAISDSALLDGFRHTEVASVSDALEQLTGKKMYMTHHMRPIFTSRFAGHALTV